MLAHGVGVLRFQVVAPIKDPRAGLGGGRMYGDVELEVDAVGADVRQDALQALVLDVSLYSRALFFSMVTDTVMPRRMTANSTDVVEARCASAFSLAWTWRQSRVACCELKNPV